MRISCRNRAPIGRKPLAGQSVPLVPMEPEAAGAVIERALFPRLTWCRSDANGGRIRSSKAGDFRNFRRRPRAIPPGRDSWSRTSIPASTAAAIRSSALPANPLKSGPICSAKATINWPPSCCGERNPRPIGGASRCVWPATTAGTANSPRPSRAATCSRSKPGPTSSPHGASDCCSSARRAMFSLLRPRRAANFSAS